MQALAGRLERASFFLFNATRICWWLFPLTRLAVMFMVVMKGMTSSAASAALLPLPGLLGRVAALGGTTDEKTALLVGLAVRQVRQQGIVLCLDSRRHKATEVQFRLLLRGRATYLPLSCSGQVPSEIAQTVFTTVSRGLTGADRPAPLVLLDDVSETPEWEQTLAFLLKAGTVVVEFLSTPAALVFGRYDTVLLLREQATFADALSRAVGRRVSVADLAHLPAGEGIFLQLTGVQRVLLPRYDR